MYNLRKVFTIIFLAIQMGVLELSVFHLSDGKGAVKVVPLGGGTVAGYIPPTTNWEALFIASIIGTVIWFILVLSVGGGDYQGKNHW